MELILQLDAQSQCPLYRQLSQSLKDAIADGRLLPGSIMPSVRSLGAALSLSRSTILKAYDELQMQGYLESRPGQGTFVTPNPPCLLDLTPPHSISNRNDAAALSAYGERLMKSFQGDVACDPAYDNQSQDAWHSEQPLPMALWKRLVTRYYDDNKNQPAPSGPDYFSHPRLREAVASFLSRSRAVKSDVSRIVIFSNQESRFDLICRLLLDPGDCVAVENPGYSGIRQTIEANGARIIPIPVDSDGISVKHLSSLKDKIKFVCVTPSALEPSGAQMSVQRRQELLDWAHSTGAFIIEDDRNCEYRQANNSYPSIQGLDDGDCVIYLRCFSNVMAPMVRVGFMVVPECLKQVVLYAEQKIESQLPLWEQQALTDFINEGFLERQIKNSRDLYRKRSYAVIFALTHYIGRKIEVSKLISGTFVQVWFNTVLSDQQLLESAHQAGVPMASTRSCYLQNPVTSEFIISFKGWNETSINNKIMHFAYLLDCLESSRQAAPIDFSAPAIAIESTLEIDQPQETYHGETPVPVYT